jgi:uncharacterized damage-inducible protein DinB
MPAPTPAAAAFLAEMEQESVATRKLLERLPADRLAWKPHDKGMSLGQLAMHVATIPGAVTGMAKSDTLDATTVDFKTPQPTAVADIRRAFDESLVAARANLAGWTQKDLDATWRLVAGPKQLMAMPRAAVVRVLGCNHLYHHRGQLTTYLRALGVPLPSVYGPTADESPFAM